MNDDAWSSINLVFAVDQMDKFTNRFVGLKWVSQTLTKIQIIFIPAPFFSNRNHTCRNQFCQYSLNRTLSNAYLNGNFPRCWLWSVGKADKHMDIVTEKSPGFEFFVFIIHILDSLSMS